MLPSTKTNEIIMYWLARAMYYYGSGIELYAFSFLSNHFHLLLRDNQGQLAKFMCYFQGNVARAINLELGRHGKFWSREYDDMIVDGEDEFWDRWVYTTCNAVKAGLVERASQWPGATSLNASLTSDGYEVNVVNYSRMRFDKRRGKKLTEEHYREKYILSVSVPQKIAHLPQSDRQKYYEELIHHAEKKYAIEREGRAVLGLKKLVSQKTGDRPKAPSKRPRVRIFSFNPQRRKELVGSYRLFVDGYKSTLNGFFKAAISGRRPMVEWPTHSYPPSMWTPIGCAAAV